MNSNTSSTGRERRDRPGFGWAGRSAALALWIISVLLWCVLMRQSFNLSSLTGAGWGITLRRVLAAACWGFLPGVLVLAGTVGCLTTVIFPEAARYWGVADISSPAVQAFGVLDLADPAWWNPAWLYVRMGIIVVLAWSMAQVWETLAAEKNVWQPVTADSRA